MKDKVRGVAGAGLLALLAWAIIGCGAGQGSPSAMPSSSLVAASTSVSVSVTPPTAPSSGTPVAGTGQGSPTGAPSSSPAAVPASVSAPVTPSSPAPTSGTPVGGTGQVVGTVMRFSAGATSVEVTIDQDNPAVRDFLALLPLTLTLEEFAGREKIGYLPRRLAYSGSPGSEPEDGDLIYYVPWGNIGFYYNTADIGYSDQTIHLGTYNAPRGQLDQLDGQAVTVEVVRR